LTLAVYRSRAFQIEISCDFLKGEFDVMVGSASDDIRQTTQVEIAASHS